MWKKWTALNSSQMHCTYSEPMLPTLHLHAMDQHHLPKCHQNNYKVSQHKRYKSAYTFNAACWMASRDAASLCLMSSFPGLSMPTTRSPPLPQACLHFIAARPVNSHYSPPRRRRPQFSLPKPSSITEKGVWQCASARLLQALSQPPPFNSPQIPKGHAIHLWPPTQDHLQKSLTKVHWSIHDYLRLAMH